jgi:hypothetical protein
MADESQISFVLDLDAADFVDAGNQALAVVEGIGDPSKLEGLVDTLSDVIPVFGAVALAAEAFKVALDLTIEGEQIQRTQDYFNQLAIQAGINAGQLKTSLENASGGLIPMNDLLGIANKAIIAMGASASKLPEVLELARKAALVTGENVQTVFQGMVDSISHANTRMLKHYGIVIDQNAAYQKLADSLGITKNELSEAGKQQAILDAALEAGSKSLAGVSLDARGATEAAISLKTGIKELGESFATLVSTYIGPTLKSALEGVGKWFHEVALGIKDNFGKGAEQAAAHTERLKIKISELEDEVKRLQKAYENVKGHDPFAEEQARKNLEAAHQALLKYQIQLHRQVDINKEVEKSAKETSHAEVAADDEATKKRLLNQEKLQKDNIKFTANVIKLIEDEKQARVKQQQEILKAEDAKLKAELKNVNSAAKIEAEITRQGTLRKEQSLSTIEKINAEYAKRQESRAQEIAKVEQAYSASDIRRKTEIDLINKKYANDEISRAKLVQLEKERFDNEELQAYKTNLKLREQLDQQMLANSKSVHQGIGNAAKLEGDTATAGLKDYGKMGQQIYKGLETTAVSGFAAIGTAIAQNQNVAKSAAQAMEKAFLSMVGNMATQYGTMLVLRGIGDLKPEEVAAGGALVAFGAAVSSLAGGISTPAPAAGGGAAGGGAAATTAATAPAQQTTQLQQQQQVQRTVSINIAGNYLNTQESQRTLMEIMRNETDATNFQYTKIGV